MAKEKCLEREYSNVHISTSGNNLNICLHSKRTNVPVSYLNNIISAIISRQSYLTNISISLSNFLHNHLEFVIVFCKLKKKKKNLGCFTFLRK